MRVQQIAIYESLKAFMLRVGFANAAEQTDAVWSTLNDNNFKSMMVNKFNANPANVLVPTRLALVHEGITSHEAWEYREDLEFDDGEEAPAVTFVQPQAPVVPDTAPPGGDETPLGGDGNDTVDGASDPLGAVVGTQNEASDTVSGGDTVEGGAQDTVAGGDQQENSPEQGSDEE